jgi:hypothetical protein
MDLRTHIAIESPAAGALPHQPDLASRAPVKVAGERGRRDWLSIAWTGVFGIYSAAALPLLGWGIAQAL